MALINSLCSRSGHADTTACPSTSSRAVKASLASALSSTSKMRRNLDGSAGLSGWLIDGTRTKAVMGSFTMKVLPFPRPLLLALTVPPRKQTYIQPDS